MGDTRIINRDYNSQFISTGTISVGQAKNKYIIDLGVHCTKLLA